MKTKFFLPIISMEKIPSKLSKILSCFLVIFLLLQFFYFLPTPQEAKADGVSWYNSSWLYRKPITVDNTSGTSTLTNYQVQVTLNSSNFDFSKARTNGEDIRFTDSDGTTSISYWIESYDSVGHTAVVWPEVPSILASSTKTIYMYYGNSVSGNTPYDYFKLSIDTTTHNTYGLAYPVTYEFSIPPSSSGLKAYKRYTQASAWTQITEKISSDFFNGIEVVRFDYPNSKAYISVAFSDLSDEIHLKITNTSDETVDVDYQGMPDYYDNRDAAVTVTGDDWYGTEAYNTGFKNASDALASRKIWFTSGITVLGARKLNGLPVVWSEVQSKIDADYIEIASHSREHLGDSVITYYYSGTHTGSNNQTTTLTDSVASFPVDAGGYTRNFVGWIIQNATDGSSCIITGSTATTAICSGGLLGGAENDWDTGDTYAIDRYDEEIGDSKTDIINNLDLPTLDKKGSQKYVLAWLRPYGYSDATIQQKIEEYEYIVDRATVENKDSFADATYANNHYTVGGSLWLENSDLNTANNKFDSVVNAGGIYHIMMHPRLIDWADGSWQLQHLDYIKEKTNLWYVGFGHLYLYHYIANQNKVTVDKLEGESDPTISNVYDDFPGPTLNTEYWTEEINGSNGAVIVGSGNIVLDPQDNITNSAAIKSVRRGFVGLKSRLKSTDSAHPYITLSLGSGDLLGTLNSTDWYLTTFYNGYVFRVLTNTSAKLFKMTGGNHSELAAYTTSLDILNFHEYELIISNSGVSVKRDGVVILSSTDATYTSGYGLIAGGESSAGYGDTIVIDWASLSKQCTGSEPSASVGSEDGYPIAPTIGTPTVLSSSAIRWNFTDNEDNETGFRVYTNADAIAISSTTANLTYLDETVLSENTQYTRYIKAYNSYGESASSSATSTYTLADTPTGFNFTRHPSFLDIYVDSFPNPNSGLSGYLFWRTDSSANNSGWIQTREWRDPNMVEGQTYTYAVKYRNGNGIETATTTMGGVSFMRDNGGGGTPTIPQQTTSTSSVQATTTLSNTTSTIQATSTTNNLSATSTQATSSISFEKPINQMSKDEIIAKITKITQMIAQLQLLIANSISTIPNTFSFKDTLKQGMTNIAIKYLQIILNQDPDTQVAQTGVGSPGKETNYFGQKTKQAVIKFQEKYKDTILKPWGLTKSTGIIGKTTRDKLNSLLSK
ncbi:MAG: DUF2341 domain-containing protein [Chloroflexi bacterium]|nr:DUF2341 domain-containing protein [Chloroflexota bacterium]